MHKGNHLSCGQAVLQIGDKLIVGGGLGRVSSLVYLLVSSVENRFFFLTSYSRFPQSGGGDMQATLWALDVETGETLWETKLGEARCWFKRQS